MHRTLLALLALGLLLTVPGPARAGPPCLCWDLEIGEHATLPTPSGGREGYGPAEAVRDALALLDERTPVVVRMETLRRATLHVNDHERTADRLLRALMVRAMDETAEPSGTRPYAWFDAGYLVACYHEAGRARDVDGYRWIKHAIDRAKDPAPMHLGAAVATAMPRHPHHARFEAHMAAAGGSELVRRNLPRLRERADQMRGYFAKRDKENAK